MIKVSCYSINSHSVRLVSYTLPFVGWIPFSNDLIHFIDFSLSSDLLFVVAKKSATTEVSRYYAMVAGHLDYSVWIGPSTTVAAQSEVMHALAALEVDRVSQVLRQVAWKAAGWRNAWRLSLWVRSLQVALDVWEVTFLGLNERGIMNLWLPPSMESRRTLRTQTPLAAALCNQLLYWASTGAHLRQRSFFSSTCPYACCRIVLHDINVDWLSDPARFLLQQ